ncbi:hypothetical protein Gogos_011837 [Gossypium gossypioides]|uniref:Mediator of RNA polymerase II transcription subunit 25 n=1 Tax=Gossypium gossypioides TaxID=34282 RepID=A0A7J9BQM8_GOSGO|nr:hypothetical protein [Gossypium gossypioides]
MAEKQLIVAVEGTAAMGPYWQIILSDYLEKIIRSPSFLLSLSFPPITFIITFCLRNYALWISLYMPTEWSLILPEFDD